MLGHGAMNYIYKTKWISRSKKEDFWYPKMYPLVHTDFLLTLY